MALVLIAALFVTVLVWTSVTYLRRRDPLLRDLMLIFASMSMVFIVGGLRLIMGVPPGPVVAVLVALVIAQPYLTLRLVSRLRRVPSWVLWAALAGWIVGAAKIIFWPAELPNRAGWSVAIMIFLFDAVAAMLLAHEARNRGGAARIRLSCAAAATAVLGASLLLAGSRPGFAVLARAVMLIAALSYVLAFLPPRWLRRIWSRGAAYSVMQQLLASPADAQARQIWQRYCQGTRRVFGIDAVVVLLPGPDSLVRPVGDPDLGLGERRYPGDDGVARLLTSRITIDALAGWTDPPQVAVDLARGSGTRFVSAAPLPVPGAALVLLHRYRTLFADDDVAMFAELGAQAAALAERAGVLEERQRLAVIVESSADAILSKDLDGVITSWNAGAEELYGYRVEEAIGRDYAMLLAPGHRDEERRLRDRVARGERVEQLEVEHRTKAGAPVLASLTSSLITDAAGRPMGIACIVRDISELRRAEAMFRGLLEASPYGIIGVTADGGIVLINAEAERLFGYRRDELLGRSVDILVPERFRAVHLGQRRNYFADPRPRDMGVGLALAVVRKDGSEFPAEISLSALETEEGVIVSAAVRDVTERIHAQAERERLAAQAERDAAERRTQHTRRLESLGQLAGGVAHDFNNILAVIASYTELLVETLGNPVPDPQELSAARTDLAQIGRATERATRLTKQLLAFGRREITQAQVVSLNHVVGDVEQMLRRTLGEHIHLITHLDRDLCPVCVDPSQVEQVLLNLAVNARDAMPAGGTLSIDTSNTRLDEDEVADTGLAPGRYARIRISDTGTGMPPEVAERAFEPFFTTKPQGAGTGLGLATVYGICAAAGGHVRLYSENGIGTTITLVLPATDAEAGTGAPAAADRPADRPAERATAPRETILLVEDEAALREAAGRILRRAGYHVLVADGGAGALRLAQSHPDPIHLLLTDVIMPNMMGNEVAARVSALRPGIPVLYMSGYAQPVLTENGTLPPGVSIIEKPFTRSDLLDGVRARLRHGAAETPALAGGAHGGDQGEHATAEDG
ncbi:PAS domain S-box protein [Actinoplanes sp. NPDC026623]|uniref:hybrid sensor histidine kinase/response regulator n=1 Tax=Actinoplanes sp. NPDC026623 TaxID=3155610 RepID=UPI00340B6647